MVVPRWKIGFEKNKLRPCKRCGELMPMFAWTPARYALKVFCSADCQRAAKRHDVDRLPWHDSPPREQLNRLWNAQRSYEKMAVILGVTVQKINDWLGPEKYMRNPGLVEEPASRRKRTDKR